MTENKKYTEIAKAAYKSMEQGTSSAQKNGNPNSGKGQYPVNPIHPVSTQKSTKANMKPGKIK